MYATLKGFDSVLSRSTTQLLIDPKVFDKNPGIKKGQEKALKLNNLAMASKFGCGEPKKDI